MKETFKQQLATHLRAGTPIMAINTDEEKRCLEEIFEAILISYDNTKVSLTTLTYDQLSVLFHTYNEAMLPQIVDSVLIIHAADLTDLFKKLDSTAEDDRLDLAAQEEAAKAKEFLRNFINDSLCHLETYDNVTGFTDNSCDHSVRDALMATVNDDKFEGDYVFVFKDLHEFMNSDSDSDPRRTIRNIFTEELLTGKQRAHRKHIIFMQPDWIIHRDIRSCVSVLEFNLPDQEALEHLLLKAEEGVDDPKKRCHIEIRPEVVSALRGFTESEAIGALAYGVAQQHGFTEHIVATVHRLQHAMFAKDGVLKLIDDEAIVLTEQVGGFENAIEYGQDCRICFGPAARKAGLKRPKGCLLVGVPGSGKTLFGRVLARILGLPLIECDVSAVFASHVGETEQNVRGTIRKIKAKGPCVVLINEADKLFAGSAGSGEVDAGVSQRVLQSFLNFMADENDEAFIVMTMNRTLGIPVELLRSGRLDGLFYATFPTPRERLDILGIHLERNGAPIANYKEEDLKKVVDVTDRYTGAELEQICIKAVRLAFRDRQELLPTLKELLAAQKLVVPVTKLDAVAISHMDDFCKRNGFLPVSKEEAKSKVFSASPTRRQIRTTNISNN